LLLHRSRASLCEIPEALIGFSNESTLSVQVFVCCGNPCQDNKINIWSVWFTVWFCIMMTCVSIVCNLKERECTRFGRLSERPWKTLTRVTHAIS
jgi:hypothetical protein